LVVADPLQQAFVDGCADAVHVITDDFHAAKIVKKSFLFSLRVTFSYFSGRK
jgi:hypothetical protein